jgi:multidrug efflux pump subunit AcrA (membrane-fusion protein)
MTELGRRTIVSSAVLLASSVLLAGGCGGAHAGGRAPVEPRVVGKSVEDVFLLTGELRAVRSESLVTPRGEGELQIRWLAEDGAEVKEGERLAEFDPTRLIQTIEERRLRLRQAEIDVESRERQAAAETDKKRVAVEKAELEAEKARLDESIPLEYRDPKDRLALQAQWQQAKAALQKARFEREAYAVTSRADVAAARAGLEKAGREVAAVEMSLGSMSLVAPRAGIFLVGNFWQWGPEGPRKLQPGDTVWPGYTVATIPDPSEMEVQAALAEADHGRIAVSMKARCILDTYPDRVFDGRIEEIGSVATEAGRSSAASGIQPGFPVRIALARTDPLMRPGLSVRVEVVRGAWQKALSVPRGAVRFETNGAIVRRPGGSTVPVRLAACTPVECVVESGLAEGDRVAPF